MLKSFRVPNDKQIVLSPGQRHIKSPVISQEPQIAVFVMSHTTIDHDTTLLTLE